ncbi:MAG: hypothetical protein AAGJ79_12380, partial [Verrucomicrobiota bacterium]
MESPSEAILEKARDALKEGEASVAKDLFMEVLATPWPTEGETSSLHVKAAEGLSELGVLEAYLEKLWRKYDSGERNGELMNRLFWLTYPSEETKTRFDTRSGKFLKEFERLHPDNPAVQVELGAYHNGIGNYDIAAQHWTSLVGVLEADEFRLLVTEEALRGASLDILEKLTESIHKEILR